MRVLEWAVTTQARYIAMIGSKRKVINVIKELQASGMRREAFEKTSRHPERSAARAQAGRRAVKDR